MPSINGFLPIGEADLPHAMEWDEIPAVNYRRPAEEFRIVSEDAERLLVRPMEQELRSIENIKEMRSRAETGHASVLLEFDAGFDADKALRDVREAINLVKPDLPDETDEPTAHEVNVGLFPVLVVTLAGDVSERTLLKIARNLQRAVAGGLLGWR